MAMPEETGFLSRMLRLEQLRSNTKLVGVELTAAFEKAETKSEEEKDERPFSERYAKYFLDTYEEIQFRRGGYMPFATELTIDEVVGLMELPWFKRATSPDESAAAVQSLFNYMALHDPAAPK